MDTSVPVQVKKILMEQELQIWQNTLFQHSMRYRVQKRIGGTHEQLKTIEDEMVKCETAIEELKTMLGELDDNTGSNKPN